MASRTIYASPLSTGIDATFSFEPAARPDCPHLLATMEVPRALVPSNKRIISVVASTRITGRSQRKFLPRYFYFPFTFSSARASESDGKTKNCQWNKRQKHLCSRWRKRKREREIARGHGAQKGKLHFNLIARRNLKLSRWKSLDAL